MIAPPLPTEAPELDQAKQWLEQSLSRLINGALKTAVVSALLLAMSQVVPAVRYLSNGLVGIRDVLWGLSCDLCGVAAVLLVVRWALPGLLRKNYQPLFEHGRLVPVAIQLGPHGLHQGFSGQSTQPYMVRGAVEGMEFLLGGWLPTRPVNFNCLTGQKRHHTAFLYPDEKLPGKDPAYALVDPRNPGKIWLARQPLEGSP